MISKFMGIAIYAVFISGVLLVFYESFALALRRIKRKNDFAQNNANRCNNNSFIRYTEDMLAIVFPSGKVSFQKLLIFSFILFLTVSIIFYPVMGIKVLAPALFFLFMPFLIIRFKLEKNRNKGSKEAEKLVTGLLNSYRINHKNIFAAVEGFIREKDPECELTNRFLYQFLIDVRSARNKESVKKASDKFAFGIKTNWSYMLSQCIFAAAYEGTDISEPLEDILEQLKTARVLEEEKKRANSESIRLVKFLVPVSYAASIGISVFMMDIPLKKIIGNQFSDITGAGIFLIIAALFVVNTLLLDMIKNGKFDY
ncbi:MAG: hypothetical protein E7228_03965 [Clostridiales bacterium]|nr:hypothetical protein [Clostridiales bacterium]